MFKTTLSSQPLLTYSDNPSLYILSPHTFVLQFFFCSFLFFFLQFFLCVCLFLCFFFWSHTIIINAHFKSCHTNSNSIGKEEGSSSTGDGFEVPSSYYSINIFQVTNAEKKKKIQKSKGKESKIGMRSYTRQPSQPIRPLQQKKVILYSDTSQKSVSQKFRTQKTTKIILKLDPKYSFEKNLF